MNSMGSTPHFGTPGLREREEQAMDTQPRTKRTLLLIAALLAACYAPDRSLRVLDDAGYTKVKTTGWRPFMCSDSDTFSTGFEADNANGKRVSGVVCCGLVGKQCTVRH